MVYRVFIREGNFSTGLNDVDERYEFSTFLFNFHDLVNLRRKRRSYWFGVEDGICQWFVCCIIDLYMNRSS